MRGKTRARQRNRRLGADNFHVDPGVLFKSLDQHVVILIVPLGIDGEGLPRNNRGTQAEKDNREQVAGEMVRNRAFNMEQLITDSEHPANARLPKVNACLPCLARGAESRESARWAGWVAGLLPEPACNGA